MIYLEEVFNLKGASWEALDAFIEFARNSLLPVCPEVGARLVAAWSSSEEWFCQVTQVMEFDDLDGLKSFRIETARNEAWGIYAAGLEEQAPVRRSRLLEPLGPVPPEVLHRAMSESEQTPVNVYLQAILEVGTDKMTQFKTGLSESHKVLPIIACWRPIGGSPNEVIDVWKAPEPETAYQPADDFRKRFMRAVREVAPKERVVRMLSLPYSPLK